MICIPVAVCTRKCILRAVLMCHKQVLLMYYLLYVFIHPFFLLLCRFPLPTTTIMSLHDARQYGSQDLISFPSQGPFCNPTDVFYLDRI